MFPAPRTRWENHDDANYPSHILGPKPSTFYRDAFSGPATAVQKWSDRIRILAVLAVERMKGTGAARIAQLPPDMILALVQHTTVVPESVREKLRKPWEYMRADPHSFIGRLVWYSRLTQRLPSLNAFPYLLNDRSELAAEHLVLDASLSSPSLPGLWQGPYMCSYRGFEKLCMILHGQYDATARETALRGARFLSQLRCTGRAELVPFFGVVAEERRLVALFSYPSHLYGPPVLLMDHIRAENATMIADPDSVAERLALADDLAAAVSSIGLDSYTSPPELCLRARTHSLVVMPSLRPLVSPDLDAKAPMEAIAELIKLVLSFPDKDGTPRPPPSAALRAINLLRRNKPLPLRAFLMISHHFFGDWPSVKLYDDARAALEDLRSLRPWKAQALLDQAGYSAYGYLCALTTAMGRVTPDALDELFRQPWFSGTGGRMRIKVLREGESEPADDDDPVEGFGAPGWRERPFGVPVVPPTQHQPQPLPWLSSAAPHYPPAPYTLAHLAPNPFTPAAAAAATAITSVASSASQPGAAQTAATPPFSFGHSTSHTSSSVAWSAPAAPPPPTVPAAADPSAPPQTPHAASAGTGVPPPAATPLFGAALLAAPLSGPVSWLTPSFGAAPSTSPLFSAAPSPSLFGGTSDSAAAVPTPQSAPPQSAPANSPASQSPFTFGSAMQPAPPANDAASDLPHRGVETGAPPLGAGSHPGDSVSGPAAPLTYSSAAPPTAPHGTASSDPFNLQNQSPINRSGFGAARAITYHAAPSFGNFRQYRGLRHSPSSAPPADDDFVDSAPKFTFGSATPVAPIAQAPAAAPAASASFSFGVASGAAAAAAPKAEELAWGTLSPPYKRGAKADIDAPTIAAIPDRAYTVVVKSHGAMAFLHKKGAIILVPTSSGFWVGKTSPGLAKPDLVAPSLSAAVTMLASLLHLERPYRLPAWSATLELIDGLESGRLRPRHGVPGVIADHNGPRWDELLHADRSDA